MSDKNILIDRTHPGVTILTLNRPEKRNALNRALLEELCSAIETANNTEGQRVIVLCGAGKVFCAGLDLKEAMNNEVAHDSAQRVAQTLKALYSSPLVTIAAVHGAAMAGGAGLVSACDFAVAAEGFVLGYPETKRGLVAGLVMTLLRRKIQETFIRELLLLGEPITAERALRLGLLNRVVPEEELLKEVLSVAGQVLQGAPQATAQTKRLLEDLAPSSLEEGLNKALDYHMNARLSNEANEGIKAFLEKREPSWTNK
ncbi:MAG: methylglutaconyl-CoA hydratase [Chlamydiales bacterium]|jgi:methylglutaconyl-CoA hydratase